MGNWRYSSETDGEDELSVFTPRPFYFRARSHRYPPNTTLGEPWMEALEKRKILCNPGMEFVPNIWRENILCTTQCTHTVSRTRRLVTALRMDGYEPNHSPFSSDLAHLFGPLRSTWLASDLYRTPTWSSCLRHRHLTPISSTQELQALLPRCVEFFTVNDNCVKVWCVPFATNVPDISDSLSVLSLLYNVLYQLHIKMYTMLNVVSFQDRWRNYYTNITSMVKQWHLCSFHSGSAHYSSGMYALLAKPAC